MLEKHGNIYVFRGQVLLPNLSYPQCFGKAIRYYREIYSYSQSDIATQLDLKVPAVSKLESGSSIPNIMQVKIICKYLDIKEQALFDLASEIYKASNSID